MAQSQKVERRPRVDALLNRERILEVALEELPRSADVPLSVIARKAGVGQGTFYRHFPTREALVMEVYRYEMLQVAKYAEELLGSRPPDQALREWMARLADYAMNKAGLADALREVSSLGSCAAKETYAPVVAAAQALLDANERAGTIRPGITTDDFFLAIAGIWQIKFNSEWKPRLGWLMDFVMDGLRVGAPSNRLSK